MLENKIRLVGGPFDGREEILRHEELQQTIMMKTRSLPANKDPAEKIVIVPTKWYKYEYKEMTPEGVYLYYYNGVH